MAYFKKHTKVLEFSKTVPASPGAYNADIPEPFIARKSRMQIVSLGANVTIKTQESFDGTTWVDLESHTTTGIKTEVKPFAPYLRTRMENGDASSQSAEWYYILEYEYHEIHRG